MADNEAAAKGGPKTVQMHRTVHELITGKGVDERIDAGVILTDEIAKKHKLDAKALDALTGKGALDLVDVLKD